MAKAALVTGAYGFIGRHVARQLAQAGWRVTGLGHGAWTRDEWQEWGIAEWHGADITLESLTTYAGEPELIVHCAGSGSVGFSMAHPYQDFQRTVSTTLATLEYARLYAPHARIVYPSSAGVYGIVRTLPITEDEPLRPTSPYGVHKHQAEELCASYAQHFGISVAVVRLFSVYGIGLRKQLLWDASQKIVGGENAFFGTGGEIRDWLHVEDAARLLIDVARLASVQCPVLNGGSGEGVTVKKLLEALFAALGRSDVPQFSGIAREGDPPGYVADVARVRATGWAPTIPWRQGVAEYAAWFREMQKL